MLVLISGLCIFLNLLIIIRKFRKLRIIDGIVDLGLFALVCCLTAGSYAGMTAGMVCSVLMSLYLAICPIQKRVKKSNKRPVKAGLLH